MGEKVMEMRRRCRKCKQHKSVAGGMNKRVLNQMIFTCKECKEQEESCPKSGSLSGPTGR